MTGKSGKGGDYTVQVSVAASPREVFEAVNNVRGWWSENIDGKTDEVGAEFRFHHKDLHYSTQRITELVPDRRVSWHVTDSKLNFVKDTQEWNGTDIVFDISRSGEKTDLRFTHVGLVPTIECYGDCSGAWRYYIEESLPRLIATGKGKPEVRD